jgi:hypothetical protein
MPADTPSYYSVNQMSFRNWPSKSVAIIALIAEQLTQKNARVASFDGAVLGRNTPNFHILSVGLSRN